LRPPTIFSIDTAVAAAAVVVGEEEEGVGGGDRSKLTVSAAHRAASKFSRARSCRLLALTRQNEAERGGGSNRDDDDDGEELLLLLLLLVLLIALLSLVLPALWAHRSAVFRNAAFPFISARRAPPERETPAAIASIAATQ
jgi:hypothetical protein